MIELKRKQGDIVFNIEKVVPLKESKNKVVPMPLKLTPVHDLPFRQWRDQYCDTIEEIKEAFMQTLELLPPEYVYHVNNIRFEQDLEQLIYRTSSNRAKSFIT